MPFLEILSGLAIGFRIGSFIKHTTSKDPTGLPGFWKTIRSNEKMPIHGKIACVIPAALMIADYRYPEDVVVLTSYGFYHILDIYLSKKEDKKP